MNDEPIAAREAAHIRNESHVRSGSPDPLPAVSP